LRQCNQSVNFGQKQPSATGCSGVADLFELLAGAPWLTPAVPRNAEAAAG